MVRVRIVAGPEELVFANVGHLRRDRPLVRIRRDEALTLEVERRLLLQTHRRVEPCPGERRVSAIEEVADPARLRLQHHDAQTREALENTELKEGREGLLHALPSKEVQVPDRPAEIVEAMVHVEGDRLEGGVDRERHVEILSGREDRVVPRIAVRYPCDGERADER